VGEDPRSDREAVDLVGSMIGGAANVRRWTSAGSPVLTFVVGGDRASCERLRVVGGKGLPPMPHSPLATSSTTHQVCGRMFSPSISTIASVSRSMISCVCRAVKTPSISLTWISSMLCSLPGRVDEAAIAVMVRPIGARHIGQIPDIDPLSIAHTPTRRLRSICAAAEARARASELGVRVLGARATQPERGFPFGAMRQLFERPFLEAESGERERWLPGAAALAADVLTGAPMTASKAPGLVSAGDPGYAWQHGLYWLAANLAIDSPLALVVDDLQWCDAPSARALAFIARRLEGQPLALILATRPLDQR
jgi:hypothetical protein